MADLGFSVLEFGDEAVGRIIAFGDEADFFGGIGDFIKKSVGKCLVGAIFNGTGGFADDDGGDGVFLVIDIKIESGLLKSSVT